MAGIEGDLRATRTTGIVFRHYAPATLDREFLLPLYTLLASAPLVVAFSALFVTHRRWPQALGMIALTVLCAGGLVLAVGFMVLYDQDPAPNLRYGISMAPLLVLAFAAALVGRWARVGFIAFAVALFATTVGALVA